ncbi:MAG TPA: radical SAM family heme chaperone HemW [Alphaproteobacteria bacterium]|nr:radical SAM family heme chaperone HemW [Alphaproteobacteria bacterium]
MTEALARRAARRDTGAAERLAIYVHWPFCLAKCPYCDFNSHVRERIDQARWRRALLAELDHYAEETKGRRVASLFFGGGTPSLMAPETVAAVIDRVRAHWPQPDDPEITLEANPTSVEAGRLASFAAAGVNRISLGVQALDDDALRFLGRRHSSAEARAALALAHRHFRRVSFDLIYARPGQTVPAWRGELARALAHAGGHLSLYQLTIEPETAFAQAFARGDLALPDESTASALYEVTGEALAAAGFHAYEISNYARPGEESRHNLAYWRYDDYVGVGPGAHGRLTIGAQKIATRQHRAPEIWLERVERHGHATQGRAELSAEERLEELLMMGLRLAEGVGRARFRRETGASLEERLDPVRLADLIEGGFLVLDGQGLRATTAGRLRLNAILAALLA